MNLTLSFSEFGLVVFVLPMLINIVYALFPPAGDSTPSGDTSRPLEIIEKLSRLAYLLAIACLKDRRSVNFRSAWLYIAAVFLILYYLVWIRYFAGGRDVSLLGKSFMFVPMPLAVFPVLYYLFGAIWLRNLPAAILMLIFGFAHITISYRSFGKPKVRGKYSNEAQRSEDTK